MGQTLISSIAFLIFTELPLFKSYFARNWPLFSHKSGFVMLGAAMVLTGNGILGNLNKEATSQESLGLAFWRIVIASGIIVMIMGMVNLFAVSQATQPSPTWLTMLQSYIFRDTKIGLSARHVRSHGAVAEHKVTSVKTSFRKSFHLGRDRDSLPSYYTRSTGAKSEVAQTPPSAVTASSPISGTQGHGGKSSGSPEVAVPNLAHHPAMYANRA